MLRRALLRLLPAAAAAGCATAPRPAPDFELLELSGRYLRLSEYKGRRVLLTFWTTSCGVCRRELPDLNRIRLEYGSRGVAVLTVCGDSRDSATAYLNQNSLDLITVTDPQFQAFQDFGVGGVPTTLLIDEEGLVRHRWSGMAGGAIRQTLDQPA